MRRQIIPCLSPLDAPPGSTDVTQIARSVWDAHAIVTTSPDNVAQPGFICGRQRVRKHGEQPWGDATLNATRARARARARADSARTAGHSDRSSKPGGLAPVAACHAAAAPRWATTRDTAAPTANETDHTSASRHRTPRDAGFAGGSSCRLARQTAVIPQRKAAAAAAPDANATTSHIRRLTPNSFPARTLHNRTLSPDRSMQKLCASARCRPDNVAQTGALRGRSSERRTAGSVRVDGLWSAVVMCAVPSRGFV
jgi:hypothetical protein